MYIARNTLDEDHEIIDILAQMGAKEIKSELQGDDEYEEVFGEEDEIEEGMSLKNGAKKRKRDEYFGDEGEIDEL